MLHSDPQNFFYPQTVSSTLQNFPYRSQLPLVELNHFQEDLYNKVNLGALRPDDPPELMAPIQKKLYNGITAKSADFSQIAKLGMI